MKQLVLMLGLAVAAAAPAATTVVLRPGSSTPNSGDAYNASASPAGNFGNAGALVVAGNGAANTNGEFVSLLKFDLAAVVSTLNSTFGAGQWSLDSVQLQLTSVPALNSSFNANAAGNVAVTWLADDSWTESGITWNGVPGIVAGGTQSLGTFSYDGGTSTTSYTLGASAGFLNDLQNGGVASLELSAADPNVSITMNSRNFTNAANRPALFITASPEPGRASLLLMGFGSVWFRRIRR